MEDSISIEGARQNNLRNLSLELPLGELTVITGVSGSGKSSLAFDTIYAEGQRRYVETFSPYARQFLERMDKPQVDAIRGIPPAIAIEQSNPVRTSRSTVGTMTELNDYLKLLYARVATLHCRGCDAPVSADSADAVAAALLADPALAEQGATVSFRVELLPGMDAAQMTQMLAAQGYTRVSEAGAGMLAVVQDRLRLREENRSRLTESLEAAFRLGARQARGRRRRARARAAFLEHAALRAVRHRLRRGRAECVLVQLAARRLRDLPRLRALDRHRLPPRGARSRAEPAPGRDQAVADRELSRVPAGYGALREEARGAAGCAVAGSRG